MRKSTKEKEIYKKRNTDYISLTNTIIKYNKNMLKFL